MSCRLQVLIDGHVAFPLIDKPVAHAEFEAQLLHVAIEWIEVLVVQHARRHVDGVALIPIVAFAADLRIAVALERIKIGLRMGVAVTLGVGQIDEDRADRYARRTARPASATCLRHSHLRNPNRAVHEGFQETAFPADLRECVLRPW